MKSIVVAVLASLIWSRPVATPQVRERTWPAPMPRFVQGVPEASYELKNGTTFVSLTTLRGVDEVLASARTEYLNVGWQLEPIAARDMLIFTCGNNVAAVQALATARGTLVTSIQRNK